MITATIDSKEKYSAFKLPVTAVETYQFTCNGRQRWKDWFFKS